MHTNRTATNARRVSVVDSHTAGEPTRLVLEGGPDLGSGSLAQRVAVFRQHFDGFRCAVVQEPRGSDVVVGALLCEPSDKSCVAGVIFFNNVSYLGMCGHGTIGLVATLAYLGRIGPGAHRVETPVGQVDTLLHDDGRVTVRNVASYRHARGVRVDVEGHGHVTGDVAWGGNWFFLVEDHGQDLVFAHVEELTDLAWRIRKALDREGITGAQGAPIDHIELFAPPAELPHPMPYAQDFRAGGAVRKAFSRNFVLCPGKAYDRSPCGTGTSAKVACLAADGKLAPGEIWTQESIIGSRFDATYTLDGDQVRPQITGEAFVTMEGTLVLDPRDPFREGIHGA
jgi:4-hydroxyproline epimerase